MASRPGRHHHEPPHRRWLQRDAIVDAALVIADREGFEAVSMRRVAAELGVGTMSLYHHVADKDELVYEMADAIGAEMLIPGEVPDDWREGLRQIALHTRDTFLRHSWLLEITAERPVATPNTLRHIEQTAAAVAGLDVDERTAMAMVMAVDDYTLGFVLREQHVRRWERGGVFGRLQELLSAGEFPLISRWLAEGRSLEPPPARFEDGLDWLLDGMAAALERR
ncbi:MAG TPA: TetR/AcrR family transcriptional regulator [Solirubrobacteraceae bacterium]|jgi:AcrR family transcriptional regulator